MCPAILVSCRQPDIMSTVSETYKTPISIPQYSSASSSTLWAGFARDHPDDLPFGQTVWTLDPWYLVVKVSVKPATEGISVSK